MVASSLSRKITVPNFDEDDMRQEIFLMACAAIEKSYDGERPLINFLWVHCRNRTLNFRRDNYYRGGNVSEQQAKINTVRRNLANPIDIDLLESAMVDEDSTFQQAYENEILAKIDTMMPVELREYWLKWRSGVSISSHRKKQVEERLKEILANECE